MGNLGDCKAVGGVFELRVPVGPGLRVYFGMVNNLIVLLISGGDKSTQESDIKKAKELFDEFKETL
jgi:putative addiction module killer protein